MQADERKKIMEKFSLKTTASLIKSKAIELGFSGVSMAKAEFMEPEATRLDEWLNQSNHGSMSYMENHFELRVDPTKLVPGAKTVISLMYNYYNPVSDENTDAPKLSMYALGKDYHKVVRKRLKTLFSWMKETFDSVEGRVFVDSAPILERDWAKRSGLGWIGKNTLLLNKHKGSYFFLAEIICSLEMHYDHAVMDHCGTCTRCIEACPTDAISENGYVLNASKCISYLTIEHKEELPREFQNQMEDWIYGCDICQQVCPWNRFSTPHTEPSFLPSEALLGLRRKDWEELTEVAFNTIFEGSAVKRAGFKGLKRNLEFISKANT